MKTTVEIIPEQTNNNVIELVKKLNIRRSYSDRHPEGSIMGYEAFCKCDSGVLCEHRLEWIVNFLKEKSADFR
jgi:hypothetical protein